MRRRLNTKYLPIALRLKSNFKNLLLLITIHIIFIKILPIHLKRKQMYELKCKVYNGMDFACLSFIHHALSASWSCISLTLLDSIWKGISLVARVLWCEYWGFRQYRRVQADKRFSDIMAIYRFNICIRFIWPTPKRATYEFVSDHRWCQKWKRDDIQYLE